MSREGNMNIINADFKAIIFDLDGTLMDSEPLHAIVISNMLAKWGITLPPEEIEKKYFGQSDKVVMKELIETNPSITLTVNEMTTMKNNLLLESIQNSPPEEINKILHKGIREFLTALRKSGKRLAVVSASENEIVHALLKKTGLSHYFERIFTMADTIISKPNPAPYLNALRPRRWFLRILYQALPLQRPQDFPSYVLTKKLTISAIRISDVGYFHHREMYGT